MRLLLVLSCMGAATLAADTLLFAQAVSFMSHLFSFYEFSSSCGVMAIALPRAHTRMIRIRRTSGACHGESSLLYVSHTITINVRIQSIDVILSAWNEAAVPARTATEESLPGAVQTR